MPWEMAPSSDDYVSLQPIKPTGKLNQWSVLCDAWGDKETSWGETFWTGIEWE